MPGVFGFHAGQASKLETPGMEAGRYKRLSLFVARFGHMKSCYSCVFRISCIEFRVCVTRDRALSPSTSCYALQKLEGKALIQIH
jgi:hypothetical protein